MDMLSRRDQSEQDFANPSFLRSLYKMTEYIPAATGQNGLGIAGFLNNLPDEEDLTAFMTQFRDDVVGDATFTSVIINDGDPNHPNSGANLDIQYSMAISHPTPVILMRSPDNLPGFGDAYLQWFHYVINQPTIPRTISIAHGSYELEIPEQYAQSLCLLFGMLGLRGTTVLAQSGDVGVGVGNCMDSSGNVKFNIFFPASCTLLAFNHSLPTSTRSPVPRRNFFFCRSLGH
jgi:tripeptidyl-peptidase-1